MILLLQESFEQILTHLPPSMDLILCDPPFGTTNARGDKPLDLGVFWRVCSQLLKPEGVVVLFGSQPYTSELVMSNRAWFRYELIGNKNKCGSPGLAKKRPMKIHENILIFSPQSPPYYPIMTEGKPYARKSARPEGYVGRCNTHGYGLKPRTEFTNTGTRYPTSIIDMRRDFSAQQQLHPHQKPVHTLEWLIKTFTLPDAWVFDACMGSGSTGVACRNTGRNFIGTELDLEYFRIANERLI